ncbi:hypothetical protein [Labrys neptuniae]
MPATRTGERSPHLWQRLALLTGLLAIVELGSIIPMPGLNPEAVAPILEPFDRGLLGLFDGNRMARISIFALGLTPLFTVLATIEIANLLFPRFKRWQTASVGNLFRLNDYVRIAAICIAALQAYGVAVGLEQGVQIVPEPGVVFELTTIGTLVGGTALLCWLVDRVTLLGFGNGFWLIWVASGAVARFGGVAQLLELVRNGLASNQALLIVTAFILAISVSAVVANYVLIDRPLARLGTTGDREAVLAARTASLTLIWPPLLANAVLGSVISLLTVLLGLREANDVVFGYGKIGPTLMVCALIVLFSFAYMRFWLGRHDKVSPLPGAWVVFWLLCALQIIARVGGAWLDQSLRLPFYLNGGNIILSVTVAMAFLRALRPSPALPADMIVVENR